MPSGRTVPGRFGRRRWAGPEKVAASPVIISPDRTAAVLLMVVSPPLSTSRTLATAASTTSSASTGALSVTSTARSPETFPSAHTRVPGSAAPFAREPPTTDSARMVNAPATPTCDVPPTFGTAPTTEAVPTRAAVPASVAVPEPEAVPELRAVPEPGGAPGAPGAAPQATSVSASTGLAATATRAPRPIPLSRTRNRCVSPVLTHLPTSSTPPTRSSTSDTPAAATGTEGATTRISTPATTQLLRIVPHSPAATNYAQ
ncbi:hypothetical protein [Nonomuraea rubra]|uniref:Uncharacterized protein n=1 Tax=Nonomuraea rubra TaxID=46180 RepID=A0A7X0NME8_9ACTN|nr:hypothetical protein [Nonomuraea rubra]MBB6546115.1 hypothetical protein [Nonomuraea rubra]